MLPYNALWPLALTLRAVGVVNHHRIDTLPRLRASNVWFNPGFASTAAWDVAYPDWFSSAYTLLNYRQAFNAHITRTERQDGAAALRR